MVERIRDAVGWGVATGITLAVAGTALKGMKRMVGVKRRRIKKRRR